jgi:hypothetical protein
VLDWFGIKLKKKNVILTKALEKFIEMEQMNEEIKRSIREEAIRSTCKPLPRSFRL